ncbi:zinc finger protein, partial [Clarias magur]
APIIKENEMNETSMKKKEQFLVDNIKSDPAHMKVKKRRENQVNEKDVRGETKEELLDLQCTPSGRVRRHSAQVAVFHLQEIAEDELAKDWGTKRRIKDDLVPDIKR